MLESAAIASKGTLLKIGDKAVPENFLTVGRITSVGEVKRTRETQDATAHDSPGEYREFIPGLRDVGEITVRGQMKKADAGQAALEAAEADGDPHAFQIVFPPRLGKRWVFNALVIEFGTAEAEVEGILNYTATLKVTGGAELEDVPNA